MAATESIYTDLAREARELHGGMPGVEEKTEKSDGVEISRIEIQTPEAGERLGKLPGRYVTIEAPMLADRPLDLFSRVSVILSRELSALMQGDSSATVLMVGLGNRFITPDSLGPRVADKIYVTRHIREHVPEAFSFPVRSVCALAPGVLGATGLETLEVIRGVVEHVKPDVLLAVDALASRRAARISTAIQLTDTGIQPGGGVGNPRAGLCREELGVPVIAVGVPMVVHASTISRDTISLIAEETGCREKEERLLELAGKVMDEHIGPLVVTPKDIDVIVEDMSRVLADGINIALFNGSYDEVKNLIA